MLKAEPAAAASPWRSSYERTARAIAKASEAQPLFAGEDGPEKTAALVVSVAWFESRFQPDALGDHERLADGRKGEPTSFCAMQINRTNLAGLGVSREKLLGDIDACIGAGLRLMRASFRVCAGQEVERRLDWYAVGGNACTRPPRDEGAHRMRKGMWLFSSVPRPPRVNPG